MEHGRRHRREADLSDEVIAALAAEAPAAGFFEERLEVLLACLERLAPRAREIVRLRYHEEQEPQEIARQLRWSPAAVSVALSRARQLLRSCVEGRSGGAA